MDPVQKKIQELKVKFMVSLSDRLNEAKEAFEERDAPTMIEVSHKIKGTAACLELMEISEIGRVLHEASENEGWDVMEKQLQLLKGIVDEFASSQKVG